MSDDLNADLEVVETPAEEQNSEQTPELVKPTAADYPEIKDYFNLESPTDAQKEKFGAIWEYFAEESKSVGDLMFKMRNLENRLGSPEIGESRLQKMYNYIRISADIKDKELRRDALLR